MAEYLTLPTETLLQSLENRGQLPRFFSNWGLYVSKLFGVRLTKLVAVWLKYQPIVDNFGIDFHPCARGHRKRRPGVPHQEPFLRPAPPFWRLGRTEGPFFGHHGATRGDLEGPGHPRAQKTQMTQMTETPKRSSRCSGSTVLNICKGAK